jgi:hypothetical protein
MSVTAAKTMVFPLGIYGSLPITCYNEDFRSDS